METSWAFSVFSEEGAAERLELLPNPGCVQWRPIERSTSLANHLPGAKPEFGHGVDFRLIRPISPLGHRGLDGNILKRNFYLEQVSELSLQVLI